MLSRSPDNVPIVFRTCPTRRRFMARRRVEKSRLLLTARHLPFGLTLGDTLVWHTPDLVDGTDATAVRLGTALFGPWN